MFQFRRFPTYAYLIQRTLTEYCSAGFPHSEIRGLTPMCGSPRLIAACHVLLRLLMPRHSPCALFSLTFVGVDFVSFASCKHVSELTPSLLPSKLNPLRWASIWLEFWFSQELCRPQIWFIVVFVLPYLKVHKLKLCYLSVACSQFLACFTVQFSRCSLQPSSRSD